MKRKGLIITISIIAFIVGFLIVINVIPPKKVMDNNPFLVSDDELPKLCAHRGGSINSPENTLKAFHDSIELYGVEIFETDMWLTKDKQLVLNHDGTLNRTSDAEIIFNSDEELHIGDFTLEELQNVNFGYDFQDEFGNFPYRNIEGLDGINRKQVIKDNKLSIVTLEEYFNEFYTTYPNLLFIVEIKNEGEDGYIAADILDDLLTNKFPNYKERVVVGTFHKEIEEDLKLNHQTLYRGASESVATTFIITELLKVNIFDTSTITCLQLPTKQAGIDLTMDMFISRAHKRGIAIQYWTINDEETMRYLIEKGCDAIMTDNPKLLKEVLDSYKS